MDICKTDIEKILKYLDDATILYENTKGQRYTSRAWCIRQLTTNNSSLHCPFVLYGVHDLRIDNSLHMSMQVL